MRGTLVFALAALAVPVLLTQVKVPAVLCSPSANIVVESISAEVSLVHCKGTQFNVTLTLWNPDRSSFDGFLRIDGWDAQLNTHVSEALVRVRLEPGERKTIWEMLPIDTVEPTPGRYFFNATAVGAAQQSTCSEQLVPLYQYLVILLKK
ncbi:MAG: hypothetical protein QXJ59_10285 [Thermofilaceae archaeon]